MSEEPQKPDIMRVFIAVPLTDEAKEPVKEAIIALKKNLRRKDYRWVPFGHYHITLEFLGNIPVLDVPQIEEVMKRIACDSAPFSVDIGPVGLFPNPTKARLLVVEVTVNDRLKRLQAQLSAALKQAGYEVETRKFRPHITVARMNKPVSHLPEPENGPEKRLTAVTNAVDRMHLYHSDPQPGGVVYTILRTCMLG